MPTILPRSQLNLDFTKLSRASGDNYPDDAARLDSVLAFSRASTAGRTDSGLVFGTVASDLPRFDYDGTSGYVGLRVEPARTNLALYSFDASARSFSACAVGATSADHGYVFKRIDADVTVTSFHVAYQSVTFATGTKYTVSAIAVGTGASTCAYIGVNSTPQYGAQFNLTGAGAVISASTNVTARIKALGFGFYQIEATFTTAFAGAADFYYGPAPVAAIFAGAGTPTAFVGTGLQAWFCGMQVEVGGYASSRIVTTSVAVARAADSVLTSSISPWFNPSAGTWVIDAEPPASDATGDEVFLDGPANFRHLIYKRGDNGKARGAFVNAGGFQADFTSTAVWAARAKVALSYDLTSGCSFSFNGEAVQTSGNTNVPSPSQFSLGLSQDGVWSGGRLFRVQFLPYKVSDLVLKALSTP